MLSSLHFACLSTIRWENVKDDESITNSSRVSKYEPHFLNSRSSGERACRINTQKGHILSSKLCSPTCGWKGGGQLVRRKTWIMGLITGVGRLDYPPTRFLWVASSELDWWPKVRKVIWLSHLTVLSRRSEKREIREKWESQIIPPTFLPWDY